LSLSPVPFITLQQYTFELDVLVLSFICGSSKVVKAVWVISITVRVSWGSFSTLNHLRRSGSLEECFKLRFFAFAYIWHQLDLFWLGDYALHTAHRMGCEKWFATFHQCYNVGSGKRVTFQLEGRTCHSEGFKFTFTSSDLEPNSEEVRDSHLRSIEGGIVSCPWGIVLACHKELKVLCPSRRDRVVILWLEDKGTALLRQLLLWGKFEIGESFHSPIHQRRTTRCGSHDRGWGGSCNSSNKVDKLVLMSWSGHHVDVQRWSRNVGVEKFTTSNFKVTAYNK
jgi:hypothetical protein